MSNSNRDSYKYWVGFNLIKGIGAVRVKALINYFGEIETAWYANDQELLAAGLSQKLVNEVARVRKSNILDQVWEYLGTINIQVLIWDDSNYPRRLKEIDQPPPVLYVHGSLEEADQWAVAIVGTRRFTSYGRQVVEEFSSELARNGVTVVSGLARGIDGIAHKASLDAGGRTIAVLGSGIDRIYPPEHTRLAEIIAAHGAIISDYPPGTAPEAVNFPPRNRIISGLSLAVVIIEAGENSGALITAAFAAEQGREVFAVPGNIYAPQSKGTNQLIHEGAHILINSQDLLEMLNLKQVSNQKTARIVLPADAVEAQIYSLLSREPLHVDELSALANLPIEKISATLSIMELKGIARQVGSMHYIAAHEPKSEYLIGEAFTLTNGHE